MIDLKTPVCKLYFLFISVDTAQEKGEKSAAAHWCFKVFRPHSIHRPKHLRAGGK
jgi:hypothetical protein